MNDRDDVQATAASDAATLTRDSEEAQRALARVQALLERQRRVEALVHREQTPDEEKKALVEGLFQRNNMTNKNQNTNGIQPPNYPTNN
jgi:F0F1-type ATP synthase delta subunit